MSLNLEQYQRLHGQRTRLENTVVEWYPNSWQADTVFIKRKGKPVALLCVVEVTTRIAWAHTYSSASPSAAKTVELLELMQSQGYRLDHLSTDPGSEFKGHELKEYCNERGITLHFFAAGDKRSKSVVESFNRTLRLLLAQWVLVHGQPDWDQAAIDDCLKAYNSRVHSGTGYAPNFVTPEIADKLRQAAWNESAPFRAHFNAVAAPGNKVRVAASADPDKTRQQLAAFNFTRKAGDPRWTAKIYTVKDTKGWRVRLEGVPRKLFNVRDLILAKGENVDAQHEHEAAAVEKVRKQKRKLLREGLDRAALSLNEGGRIEDKRQKQEMALEFPSEWLRGVGREAAPVARSLAAGAADRVLQQLLSKLDSYGSAPAPMMREREREPRKTRARKPKAGFLPFLAPIAASVVGPLIGKLFGRGFDMDDEVQGGSAASAYVARLIAEGRADPYKVRNPSSYVAAMRRASKKKGKGQGNAVVLRAYNNALAQARVNNPSLSQAEARAYLKRNPRLYK